MKEVEEMRRDKQQKLEEIETVGNFTMD